MKVTDYIISFLVDKGVTDIFGYPGGVICHLMDSVTKYPEIKAHINYHEQASAFAACGYAQISGKLGVAYATSGPGATNLVTGIANAYFDSIPTMFITGQVDTYGVKGDLPVRQRGFQETDIVAITKSISKYSIFVESPYKIRYYLEKAYHIATGTRPGPVVLDIPADVQRAEVDVDNLLGFSDEACSCRTSVDDMVQMIVNELSKSKAPVILVGAAIRQSGLKKQLLQLAEMWNIPVVSSMPAFDSLPYGHRLNMGFIGVNGHRYANFVMGKSDLIICLGTRLDLKQVGSNRSLFVPDAKIIRVDIDSGELQYKLHDDEIQLCCDIKVLLPQLLRIDAYKTKAEWIEVCALIKQKLLEYDYEFSHQMISLISEKVPDGWNVTVDVGQHEPWVAQAYHVKGNQAVCMSAGLGSMGYSLPAAIGVYYAKKKGVICFNGDGGIQMNIQELQFVKRERLPIKIVVLNNYSLGMIRQFQEKNFDKNYYQTTESTGYMAPDLEKIAEAYELPYYCVKNSNDLDKIDWDKEIPAIIEVVLAYDTYLNPNQGASRPIQDQTPYLDKELYDYLMSL